MRELILPGTTVVAEYSFTKLVTFCLVVAALSCWSVGDKETL